MKLTKWHLEQVVEKLPDEIKKLLKNNHLYLAGGAVLSILKGVEVKDYDFFGPNKDDLEKIANEIHEKHEASYIITTKNAITVKTNEIQDIQAITRWLYNDAEAVADSFDFHICAVVVYWNGSEFDSAISDGFYNDFSKNQATYKHPVRDEDSSGSLLRAFKYAKKDYKLPKQTISAVISRFIIDVFNEELSDYSELDLTEKLTERMEEHTAIARGNY